QVDAPLLLTRLSLSHSPSVLLFFFVVLLITVSFLFFFLLDLFFAWLFFLLLCFSLISSLFLVSCSNLMVRASNRCWLVILADCLFFATPPEIPNFLSSVLTSCWRS